MRMDLLNFRTGREEDDSIACHWRVDQVRHGDCSILSERLHRRLIDNQLTVVRPTRRNRGCCFCGEARMCMARQATMLPAPTPSGSDRTGNGGFLAWQ